MMQVLLSRLGIGAVAAFALVLTLNKNVDDAVSMSFDEGYELMKATLCAHGYPLYSQIWSDQPPLYTGILETVFALVGQSIAAARLTTIAFSFILCASLFEIVRSHSGAVVGIIALTLLWISHYFIHLSVSVMNGFPAYAVGLLSVAAICRYLAGSSRHWLVIAGVVLGLSLQIKLTAALMIPGVIIGLAPCNPWKLKIHCSRIATWMAGVAVGFAVPQFFNLQTSLDMIWNVHVSWKHHQLFPNPEEFASLSEMLKDDYGTLLAAATGSATAAAAVSSLRSIRIPIVWLVTAFVAHSVCRPYFSYYYIHLAVPLCWLAAVGLRNVATTAWRLTDPSYTGAQWRPVVVSLAAALLWHLAYAGPASKLRNAIRPFDQRATINDDSVLKSLLPYKSHVNWLFTDHPIYAFHTGCLVPPATAVLSEKRFRTGHMNASLACAIINYYKPEVILLFHYLRRDPEFQQLAARDYTVHTNDFGADFYVLKSLDHVSGAIVSTANR